jgi:putative ABC transport system permease protein
VSAGTGIPAASRPHPRPVSFGFWRNVLRFFRELREAVAQAFFSLLAHRLRAALTISGITIGVGTVIAIYSAVAGLDDSVARQLSALGPNTLFVSKWSWGVNIDNWWKFRNRPPISRGDLLALQAMARLPEAIAAFTGTQATIARGELELRNIDVRGTTEAFLDTGGWQMKRGRFLSALDEEMGTDACVVGADLEDAFFKGTDALGGQLRVGPLLRCTIVGTLVRRGVSFGHSEYAIVMLPLNTFGRAFGTKRSLVIAAVAPKDKLLETEEELQVLLRQHRRLQPDQEDNFTVNRQDKILQSFNQVTLALRVVAGLVGLITLFVGGIGIMNILLVSVKERTREIGVRRALGARRSTILLQFLSEAVAVSCVGGLLGTALGIFVAWFLAQVTPMSAAVSGEVLALGA